MEDLTLTTQRPDESTLIWASTQPLWGPAFTVEGYVDREQRQQHIPLARDGGLVPRLLTLGSADAESRPILSSCETLKKRIVYRGRDGVVRQGHAYGVASVFTPADARGKGYAGKMLGLLGDTLQRQADSQDGTVASILYSDIGKQFYSKLGWKPFESAHIEFPSSAEQKIPSSITLLKDEDLPALAEFDEQLILKELHAAPQSDKIKVALVPDVDTLRWHHSREAFTCEFLHGKVPTTHGAIHTCADETKVWVVWQRNYSSTAANPDQNKLYILRLVIENPRISDEELCIALKGILSAARKEAAEWWCGKVEWWNPDVRTRKILEGFEGWGAKYVDREAESIASLRWFGNGSVDDVEWIVNEKFGWC